MKKVFYIVMAFALLAISCEQPAPETEETPVQSTSALAYSLESVADHDVVIVKPEDIASNAPVVVVLTDDLTLRTRGGELAPSIPNLVIYLKLRVAPAAICAIDSIEPYIVAIKATQVLSACYTTLILSRSER